MLSDIHLTPPKGLAILQNPFIILKGFCNLSHRQYGELQDPLLSEWILCKLFLVGLWLSFDIF